MSVGKWLALMRRAMRRDKPRVDIDLDVFGPGDRRAVRLTLG